MRQILINDDHLNEDDLEQEIIRVKALLINSKQEILLVYNNYTYQFPGGHRKKDESLENTLTREIKEELGINILVKNEPFLQIITYFSNYCDLNLKVCSKIYYYILFTDQTPDFFQTQYDEIEKQSEFSIHYVKIACVEEKIYQEMCYALEEFKSLYFS